MSDNIKELKEWKDSAMNIFNEIDLQGIGKVFVNSF